MRNIKWVILLSWPLAGAGQGFLSLEQAVQTGLEQNLNIQVGRTNLAIAQKGNNLGNAGFLPSLNANGSFNESTTDFTQQLANSPDKNTVNGAASQNLNAGITLNYTLFNGLGRLYNLQQLRLQERLSEAGLRFTIENQLLQIFATYFQLARAQAEVKVTRNAIALSQRRYRRAQAAEELAGNTRLQTLTARVDLNTDSAAYLNAHNNYQQSLRDLNLLLQYPTDTGYAVDSVVQVPRDMDPLALQKKALENNSALLQAQISRSLRGKEVQAAWSQYMPNISANAGYNFSRQENEASFLRFTQSTGLSYGITATWNLFNSARTKTQIEQASIRLHQSKLEVKQSKMQLRTDLSKSYLDFKNARKLLALQERNLQTATRNFERAQEAYRSGQLTQIELREAQLNLMRTELQIVNLRYAAKLAEIEMQRVAGTLLE